MMPIPAFVLGALKGAAINKGLDAVGAPQGVRDAIGFATNPKGFVKGAIKDAAIQGVSDMIRGNSGQASSGGGRPSRISDDIEEIDAFKKGGKVKSASSRADGCCKRGKTRGKMY